MVRVVFLIIAVVLVVFAVTGRAAAADKPEPAEAKTIYEFTLPLLDGTPVSLASYSGKVMLLVNVASRCGFTYQYEGLQKLHTKYGAQGLVVLGFPANDFLWQEPGSNEEIAKFCTMKYSVTFPVFAKIHVTGSAQHPLYRYLTSGAGDAKLAGNISWNFNKFLVDRQGRLLARFGSRDKPEGDEIVKAIEAALAAKP